MDRVGQAANATGKRFAARLAAVACCLACVCCGGSTWKSPATGGEAWYEARSDHFVIQTDAGPDAASELMAEYERLLTFFETVAFPAQRQPAGLTRVVVFSNEKQYAQIAPRLTVGFFTESGGAPYDPDPMLVMSRRAGNRAVLRLFRHELTHRYVAFHYPTAPVWLHEGLAEYFESLEIEGDQVHVGLLPNQRLYRNRVEARTESQGWLADTPSGPRALYWLPSTEQVRKMSYGDFYADAIPDNAEAATTKQLNYIAAWAQVHTLMLGSQDLRERFMRYLNAMAHARAKAWTESFDAAAEQALEAQYRDLVTQSTIRKDKQNAPPLPVHDQPARLMHAAEVHWLWATLRNWASPEGRQGVAKDIEASIRLAPSWPEGYLLRSALAAAEARPLEQRRDIEFALAQDPKSANALALKARLLLTEQAQRPAAERRLGELATVIESLRPHATTMQHWLTLANYARLRGLSDEALAYAQIATKNSSCSACYWIIGEIELARGRVVPAARALRVAAGLAAENAPPELRRKLDEVLARGECREVPSEC